MPRRVGKGYHLALEAVSRRVGHCVGQHLENVEQRSAKLTGNRQLWGIFRFIMASVCMIVSMLMVAKLGLNSVRIGHSVVTRFELGLDRH